VACEPTPCDACAPGIADVCKTPAKKAGLGGFLARLCKNRMAVEPAAKVACEAPCEPACK
jgi:hypothetical protein